MVCGTGKGFFVTKRILMLLLAVAALPSAQLLAAESAPSSAAAPQIDGPARLTRAQDLENCMALWDPTTHITKSHWKTICKRLRTGE
jgi:hypothetical protein